MAFRSRKILRPSSAASSGTVFVAPAAADLRVGTTLARPLSAGLRFASSVCQVGELATRGIFPADVDHQSHLSHDDVDLWYDAKCVDQKAPPNAERRERFHALMSEQCVGNALVSRQSGLGKFAVAAICRTLTRNPHITHLDLSGNDVGPDGARSIAELLLQNETIVVLRLQAANLGTGVSVLAHALRHNNTLTALDLSGITGIHRNCIWGGAAAALAESVSANAVLAHLNLAHTGLQRNAAAVVNSAAESLSLTSLNLSGNHLTDDACSALRQLFRTGKSSLEALDLSANSLTGTGLVRLCNGLCADNVTAQALLTLDLAHNNLDGTVLGELGRVMRQGNLKRLTLSHNRLCDMGADPDGFRYAPSAAGLEGIFDAMAQAENCVLESFVAESCGISLLPDNLVAALAETESLEVLALGDNTFGDVGAGLIARGLARNQSLKKLTLHQCRIGEAGAAAICPAVQAHEALERLTFVQGARLDLVTSGVTDAVAANTSLTSVDFTNEALAVVHSRLKHNAAARVKRQGPELSKARRQGHANEHQLSQTKDSIRECITQREKMSDALRQAKDAHKAVVAAHRAETQDLQEQLDRHLGMVESLSLETRAVEDALFSKRRGMENAKDKVQSKVDGETQARLQLLEQAVKVWQGHIAACPESTVAPPAHHKPKARLPEELVDKEIVALKKELRDIEAETASYRATAELYQKREVELQERIARGGAPLFPEKEKKKKGGKAGKGGKVKKKK